MKVTENERKSFALYFSFGQFDHYIHRVEAWFCPVILRSSEAKKLQGRWSRAMATFLQHMLLNDTNGVTNAGITLIIGTTICTIWARMSKFLTDGGGWAQTFSWKGASAIKACPLCWNVVADRHKARMGPPHVGLSDDVGFRVSTSEATFEIIDRLLLARTKVATKSLTKTKFDAMQKRSGFRAEPHSLLATVQLRPHLDFPDCCHLDWVHNFLQDGILNQEMSALFTECKRLNVANADVDAMVRWACARQWTYPYYIRSKQTAVEKLMSDAFSTGATIRVRCAAKELLALYPIVRCYVDTEFEAKPAVAMHKTSFRLCCDMVSTFQERKQRIITNDAASEKLPWLWPRWSKAHKTYYGVAYWKPKGHWAAHHPPQMKEIDMDMFCLERMNKRAKACAQQITNTSRFERRVLLSIAVSHVSALMAMGKFGIAELQARVDDQHGYSNIKCAKRVFNDSSATFAKGDLVFNSSLDRLGHIVWCCAAGTEADRIHFVSVRTMRFVEKLCYRCSGWAYGSSTEQWKLDNLFHATAWCPNSDGSGIVVLH